ncbi:MAG: GDSL-type esterase/lipase family protein [Chloroflexota bacterium]
MVSTAAWLNGAAYLFCHIHSEDDAFDDAILRYDSTPDSLTVMKARIPTARTDMSSAAAGRYIYLFGGGPQYFSLTSDILRYDPVTDVLEVMSAQLPTGLYWTSAVWDGQAIYVVGGYPWTDQIVRCDPATNTVTVVESRLARPKDSTGSVWDGRCIYILGGDYAGEQIYRFDPAADAIELLDAQLPIMRRNGAYWDGRYAYIFGGGLQEGPYVSILSDEIVRFDPQTEEVIILEDHLPQPMWRNPAVWDGSAFYLFGGETQDGLIDPRILRWVPSASKQTKLLIAFGDSVTRGVGTSPGHDFPSLLAAAFPELEVVNAGVSGDTTESALARLERDVVSRQPDLVIVGAGGNDFLRGRSREEVIASLGEIVHRIQAQGATVILVTIGTRDPARILSGEQRSRILGEDDLHPNDRAHRLMAEELTRVLRLLLAGQPVPLPTITPVPTS